MINLRNTLALLLHILFIVSCEKDQVFENRPPVVNLGKDTSINLSNSTDSIKLAGTATDADGTVVSYLWSQVSGPKTVSIKTPGSSVTHIDGFTSGTYVFQLMATDNKGATGVKSISVTVTLPLVVNVTLQPHQNANEILLAFLNNQNVSDKNATDLSAVTWTNGGNVVGRGLFKIDLGSIPANSKILSAKLTLYSHPSPPNGNLVDANFGTNNTLLIQRVTSVWNISSVTWQTQPATDAATQVVIPHTNQSRLDLVDIDVTGLVDAMYKTGNNGFMIRLQNETAYNSRIFCSSKYPDVTKHPKLVLQHSK